MAIDVSVQYNDGLLPDIILLTQCCYRRGTRLNAMKRFCICNLVTLTRWDVSSILVDGIFSSNEWRTIKSLVHKIQIRLHGRRGKGEN